MRTAAACVRAFELVNALGYCKKSWKAIGLLLVLTIYKYTAACLTNLCDLNACMYIYIVVHAYISVFTHRVCILIYVSYMYGFDLICTLECKYKYSPIIDHDINIYIYI